jgi:hypothetical protein
MSCVAGRISGGELLDQQGSEIAGQTLEIADPGQ